MKMILLAALISAALFQAVPVEQTPANLNNSTNVPKVQAVQAKLPEKEPQITPVVIEEKAPTEPQVVIEPEISHPVGCENYRYLISQYDWNVNVMSQICQAESSGNPYAVGDNRVIGGIYAPSCGLFQIRTLSSRPQCEELKDPATNIAWAYRIYQGQGLNAWSVCKKKVNCS